MTPEERELVVEEIESLRDEMFKFTFHNPIFGYIRYCLKQITARLRELGEEG